MKLIIIYALLLVGAFSYSIERVNSVALLKVQVGDKTLIQNGFFTENQFFVTSSHDFKLMDNLLDIMSKGPENIKMSEILIEASRPDGGSVHYSIDGVYWDYNKSVVLLHAPQYRGSYMEIPSLSNILSSSAEKRKLELNYLHSNLKDVENISLREDSLTNIKLNSNYMGFFTERYPGKLSKKTSDETSLIQARGLPIVEMGTSKLRGVVIQAGLGNYLYALSSSELQKTLQTATEAVEKNKFKMITPLHLKTADPDVSFNIGHNFLINSDYLTEPDDLKMAQKMISQAAKKGHPIAQYFEAAEIEKQIDSIIDSNDMEKLSELLNDNVFPPLFFAVAKMLIEKKEGKELSFKEREYINQLLEKAMHQKYLPAKLAWSVFNDDKKNKRTKKALDNLVDKHNYKEAKEYRSTNNCSEVFSAFDFKNIKK